MTLLNRTLAAFVLALAAALAHAQSGPELGRDYVRLDPPHAVARGDKIEVIEFFYYGCPVCYELEPKLTRWYFGVLDSVALRRVPALASHNWDNFAKLFYTLDAMGQLDRLHWTVYGDFQFEGLKLNEEPEMAAWAAHNGVDPQKFADIYHSPEIPAKLAEARKMTKDYGIKGVPSIVVDGKYLTSARLAGSTDRLMLIVGQLVELARKERGK